jgi:hypothetical protein
MMPDELYHWYVKVPPEVLPAVKAVLPGVQKTDTPEILGLLTDTVVPEEVQLTPDVVSVIE